MATATLTHDPIGGLAPWKAVFRVFGRWTSYRFASREAGEEALGNAGHEVEVV
jgi:hypothetical protein